MTIQQLIEVFLKGRLIIVGEYRASRAEKTGFVDRKTGEAIQFIRAVHVIERELDGKVDRTVVYQRLPETVETPEEAVFPYVKGELYAFFVESVQWDRGQVIGRMGSDPIERVETEDEGRSAVTDAPQARP